MTGRISKAELRTPCAWLKQEYPNIIIIDPDGWRGRGAPDFAKPITLAEFHRRLAYCTVGPRDAGWDDSCGDAGEEGW